MTQSILVKSAWGTLKAKKNNMSFNWCPGWYNQWTIELVKDELDWKIRAKQPTSCSPPVTLAEKLGRLSSVYTQSLVERIPTIYEAVIAAKGG